MYANEACFQSPWAQKKLKVIANKLNSTKWQKSRYRSPQYRNSCYMPFTETTQHIYASGYEKEESKEHKSLSADDLEQTLNERLRLARANKDPCYLWDWVTCSVSEAELRDVIKFLRQSERSAEPRKESSSDHP